MITRLKLAHTLVECATRHVCFHIKKRAIWVTRFETQCCIPLIQILFIYWLLIQVPPLASHIGVQWLTATPVRLLGSSGLVFSKLAPGVGIEPT